MIELLIKLLLLPFWLLWELLEFLVRSNRRQRRISKRRAAAHQRADPARYEPRGPDPDFEGREKRRAPDGRWWSADGKYYWDGEYWRPDWLALIRPQPIPPPSNQ